LNKKVIFLTLLSILVFVPTALGAGIDVGTGLTGTKEVLGDSIQNIFTGIAYFIGITAVGALIFCGIRFVVATDDRVRLQAKAHVGWVLGGIVLASLSFIIVGYIVSLI